MACFPLHNSLSATHPRMPPLPLLWICPKFLTNSRYGMGAGQTGAANRPVSEVRKERVSTIGNWMKMIINATPLPGKRKQGRRTQPLRAAGLCCHRPCLFGAPTVRCYRTQIQYTTNKGRIQADRARDVLVFGHSALDDRGMAAKDEYQKLR